MGFDGKKMGKYKNFFRLKFYFVRFMPILKHPFHTTFQYFADSHALSIFSVFSIQLNKTNDEIQSFVRNIYYQI